MRTEETVSNVRKTIDDFQSRSVRKIAAQVGISRESVRRILMFDLRLKPYKMQTCQELSISDNERKLQFFHDVNDLTGKGQLDVNNIIFSDESHTYSNGFINKQNFRKCSSEKRREVFD